MLRKQDRLFPCGCHPPGLASSPNRLSPGTEAAATALRCGSRSVSDTPVLAWPYTTAAVPPVRRTKSLRLAPTRRRNFWNCCFRILKATSVAGHDTIEEPQVRYALCRAGGLRISVQCFCQQLASLPNNADRRSGRERAHARVRPRAYSWLQHKSSCTLDLPAVLFESLTSPFR